MGLVKTQVIVPIGLFKTQVKVPMGLFKTKVVVPTNGSIQNPSYSTYHWVHSKPKLYYLQLVH